MVHTMKTPIRSHRSDHGAVAPAAADGCGGFRRFPPRSLLLVLVAFGLLANHPRAASPEFDQWADTFTAEWVRLNPQVATRTQYFSDAGADAEQDTLDRQLGLSNQWGAFYGTKAKQTAAALARRGLDELAGLPRDALSPTQRTSAAIIEWTLENVIAGAGFPQHDFIFHQFGGFQLSLVDFLTATHPIRRGRDAENYLARLGLVAERIHEVIAEARTAAHAGFIPPRFILERTIEQLDRFLAAAPAENPLVRTFDTRMQALGSAVSPTERTAWVAAAEQEVRTSVLPAYRQTRDTLAEQLPLATNDAGLWRLPQGAAAYQQALKTSTTTSLTAEEIHAIGLREVARLESEMEKIFDELGYHDGALQERYEQLNAKLVPPAEPDPRPAIIAQIKAVIDEAERRSVSDFDLRPRAPVTVQREPAFSEASAAARYTPPAPDGSKPGIYWVPLADFSPRNTWLGAALKSTAYHEAVPGHHFQIAIQQEAEDLPRYRKLGIFGLNSAYLEGWALYAERLAAENGWYQGDRVGELGYLHLQLFRARRLVVDTGLHAKRWTRQQGIDYGFTPAETERYIVWPGQACSYMVGQLRIMELRERARAALGSKFSRQQFHNVILRGGSMPLDVLAREVEAWVAEQTSR
jgi:uncharacterized protein (DUF885 family)